MKDGRGIVAGFLIGLLVCAFVLTSALSRWPNLAQALMGDVGILPFLVAGLTVTFLGVNAWVGRRGLENTGKSIDLARRAEIATRYQKAADLLASDGQTARLGGIFLLRGVAMEDTKTYFLPALELLAAFAAERSTPILEARDALNTAIEDQNEPAIANARGPASASTPYDAAVAIDIFGKLRAWHKNNFGHAETIERQHSLSRVAFRDVEIRDGDFSGVRMNGCSFSNARFFSCGFSSATIYADFGMRVRFLDCDMRGAIIDDELRVHPITPFVKFELTNLSAAKIEFDSSRIRIDACELNAITTITAQKCMLRDVWSHDGAPDIQLDVTDDDQQVFAVTAEGDWAQPTDRGFRAYKPAVNNAVHQIVAPVADD